MVEYDRTITRELFDEFISQSIRLLYFMSNESQQLVVWNYIMEAFTN